MSQSCSLSLNLTPRFEESTPRNAAGLWTLSDILCALAWMLMCWTQLQDLLVSCNSTCSSVGPTLCSKYQMAGSLPVAALCTQASFQTRATCVSSCTAGLTNWPAADQNHFATEILLPKPDLASVGLLDRDPSSTFKKVSEVRHKNITLIWEHEPAKAAQCSGVSPTSSCAFTSMPIPVCQLFCFSADTILYAHT